MFPFFVQFPMYETTLRYQYIEELTLYTSNQDLRRCLKVLHVFKSFQITLFEIYGDNLAGNGICPPISTTDWEISFLSTRHEFHE